MRLVVEETLETLLQEAEDIRAALEEVTIEEMADEAPERVPEEFSAVAEQQYDPQTFETTVYTIDIDAEEGKNVYYERTRDAEQQERGAKYEHEVTAAEREAFEEAQSVVNKTREAVMLQKRYDMSERERAAAENMKISNPEVWFLMCEGVMEFAPIRVGYRSRV